MKEDYKSYLSNHDVKYDSLTNNDYDGLPLGNGRMGGIVLTRSNGIRLLVNRVDVLGCNSYTDVKPDGVKHPLHHANCCGWFEIDFRDKVFPQDTFQGLEYYNGLGTIKGGGIEIKIIACNDSDTIVFRIDDRRKGLQNQSVRVRLIMMRSPIKQSGPRPLTVVSKIGDHNNACFLSQVYTEPGIEGIPKSEHYCSSALTISLGKKNGENSFEKSDRAIEFILKAGGCYDIFLSSAATLDKSQDVVAMALDSTRKVNSQSFVSLQKEQEKWWSSFRGYSFYQNKGEIIPYVYHSHCFSTGAKVAWRFYLVWEYTRDKDFLRERAYPLVRGIAEFYRNYPNVKKEEDGKYHIHNVHSHEPIWGAQDTMEELCAMKAMANVAYKLSLILDTDKDLRPLWKDLADNCAPVPTTSHPDAIIPYDGKAVPERWVQGLNPCAVIRDIKSTNPARQWVHYDLATLETSNINLKELALLQSVAPAPGEDTVIRVFPAWPTQWDASFKLAARRGLIVSSSMNDGKIIFAEIESNCGEIYRIRNPWPGEKISVSRFTEDEKWERFLTSSLDLLEFNTLPNGRYLLFPGEKKSVDPTVLYNMNNLNRKEYKEWIPE